MHEDTGLYYRESVEQTARFLDVHVCYGYSSVIQSQLSFLVLILKKITWLSSISAMTATVKKPVIALKLRRAYTERRVRYRYAGEANN